MMKRPLRTVLMVALFTVGAAPGLARAQAEQSTSDSGREIAREQGNAGDRDNAQLFVTYQSPRGFALAVPETWIRKDVDNGVQFAGKDNRIDIAVSDASTAPTAADARVKQVESLARSSRSLRILQIKDVQMPAGPAVRVEYFCLAASDPVNETRVHLKNERYLFFKDGTLVAIDLSAPDGAERADQWERVARSFRWD